ncbi:hypothetical protein KDJ56_14685 [Brevibacillus composti]|uniref:Uncharacterized protein n=1 Tax=Brevibacillus composti TaxID=2796470 RepID=A0A7T5EIE1_9BACL|nr:hypothetical protein [Brevibacillus composti]QQE73165.1 hypothetical protein JD108_14740 [Brevibacillus composti]QUO40244.1 hypothetical protein KDJ56_14685 [Brevibacillus composti]
MTESLYVLFFRNKMKRTYPTRKQALMARDNMAKDYVISELRIFPSQAEFDETVRREIAKYAIRAYVPKGRAQCDRT